ncbi:MAG: hypothetical protein H0V82_05235 [Candidatus Protochlamydia sp.]|nr:hypothetical protein [Candidatus Protochlamydia sp.]
MFNYNYENKLEINSLIHKLNNLTKTTCFKNENLESINKLINVNLRLILSQTGNNDTAPQLKKSLLNLSNSILKENIGSAANNLAFEVQGYAMGLYGERSISEYELPEDLLQNIFQILLRQPGYFLAQKSGLKGCVSHDWLKLSNKVTKEWVCQEGISLRSVTTCKTATEAVEFIIKNNLTAANLSEFSDLTDDDLIKLIKNCPDLKFLCISHSKITEDTLTEALKTLTRLQHLNLCHCTNIKGDKLSEALKKLTQLQHLNLNDCYNITGDKLAEALKNLTQLQHLNLKGCNQITEDKLAEAIKTLSQMRHLNLSGCRQISEDNLADALKMLPQLQHLNLSYCYQITGDKLADTFKTLTQLQHLNLECCSQIKDKLAEALKSLTQLQHLNLGYCPRIIGDKLAEAFLTLTQLQHLDLRACVRNKERGKFADALKTLTQLHYLDLSTQLQHLHF